MGKLSPLASCRRFDKCISVHKLLISLITTKMMKQKVLKNCMTPAVVSGQVGGEVLGA